LRKEGRKIALQDQPFQVLAVLLSRPGEVITRDELRQALWPAGTFVEFDQGLNTAIKKIRLALGDSADNPRFIETIPRKGYRFIAPVDRATAPPAVAAPLLNRRLVWIGAAVCLLVVAAGVWVFETRSPAAAPVPIPLTSYRGAEIAPSFSPDGNYIAFAWDRSEIYGQGNFDIYMKLIGGGDPVRLTQDAADELSPAWSSDGRYIAFLRTLSPDSMGIFLIPAIGGAERKLAVTYLTGEDADVRDCIAWSPDGKWLLYPDKETRNGPLALYRLSVESGEKRPMTSPPKTSAGDLSPAVAADGGAVVFSRCTTAMTCDLFLMKLSKDVSPESEPQRLTFNSNALVPAWMPAGRAILFSNGPAHAPILSKLSIARGARPERLVFAGEGVWNPAISRQGRLAYDQGWLDVDICRLELNGHAAAGKPPVRLISSTRLEHEPSYSPDGKRIAFCSNRSGSLELWVSQPDGSNAVQLTSFGASSYTEGPRWSPDGRFIAFTSTTEGQQRIYVMNSEGGKPKRLEIAELADPPRPSWSQDGKWLYFGTRREGQNELWKILWPASDHGIKPVCVISKGFGRDAVESPDGKFIYFLKGSEPNFSLWRTPLDGGKASQVLASVLNNNFDVLRDGIYFIPNSQPHSIRFLSFSSGKEATVAQLVREPAWGFSVSRDGRSLVFSEYEAVRSELKLVENLR
jgi:Tol biopolymer transport system component